jgi:hypothetical protein
MDTVDGMTDCQRCRELERLRTDRAQLLRNAEHYLSEALRSTAVPGAMQVANLEVAEAKRILEDVEGQWEEHRRSHEQHAA